MRKAALDTLFKLLVTGAAPQDLALMLDVIERLDRMLKMLRSP